MAGDIVVHSVDGANGNPALGLATITWTSPAYGTVTLSGGVWFAQPTVNRSNDFVLTDLANDTVLASGTVSATNGFDRLNPDKFSTNAPFAIGEGDVIALTFAGSPGQTFGSFSGVDLTIDETVQSSTPEPASFALLLAAFPILASLLARSSKRQ